MSTPAQTLRAPSAPPGLTPLQSPGGPDAANRIVRFVRSPGASGLPAPTAAQASAPSAVLNPLRGAGLLVLGALAPFLGSEGELAVAKLQGKIPESMSLREVQFAQLAVAAWNPKWRASESWSAEQRGRSIKEAAAAYDQLTAGRISKTQFDQAMHALMQRLAGAMPQGKAYRSSTPPIDTALAVARSRFKDAQAQAGTLNQQVLAQQRAAAAGWQAAQALMKRFEGQARGGRAALPAFRRTLGEAETRLQALRAIYSQANAPVAGLKAAAQRLGQIRSGEDGRGLAPQTAQVQQQVARWSQAADAWRGDLSKQINALARWKQKAVQRTQTLQAQVGKPTSAPASARPLQPQAQAEPQLHGLPGLGPGRPAGQPARLPDARTEVTHTASVGTPADIESKRRAQVEQALRDAAGVFYERRKTLLPGGDTAALAEAVYNGNPLLKSLGVSLEQLQARLKALQAVGEATTGARVMASSGGGGGAANRTANPPSPSAKLDAYIQRRTAEQAGSLGSAEVKQQVRNSVNTELRLMLEPIEALKNNPGLARAMQEELSKSDPNASFTVVDVMRAYLAYLSYDLREVRSAADTITKSTVNDVGPIRVQAAIQWIRGGGLSPVDRELVRIVAPQYAPDPNPSAPGEPTPGSL